MGSGWTGRLFCAYHQAQYRELQERETQLPKIPCASRIRHITARPMQLRCISSPFMEPGSGQGTTSFPGLHADAHKKTLYVNSVLPNWLLEITLHNLRVGTTTLTIGFWREADRSRYDVLASSAEIQANAGIATRFDKPIETVGGTAGVNAP